MYRVMWRGMEVWCDLQSRSEALTKVVQLEKEGITDIEVWQKQWVPIDKAILLLPEK